MVGSPFSDAPLGDGGRVRGRQTNTMKLDESRRESSLSALNEGTVESCWNDAVVLGG